MEVLMNYNWSNVCSSTISEVSTSLEIYDDSESDSFSSASREHTELPYKTSSLFRS